MARLPAQGDDTAMNMTPMIDICFQLIVFFMLTLKFKSIDRRFENELPRDLGQGRQNAVLVPKPKIEVRLFREGLDRPPAEQYTKIRVGEMLTRTLPRGPWPKDGEALDARRREEAAVQADIVGALRTAWERQGRNPEVVATVRTPAPNGAVVPHGDVMLVLDAFAEVGLDHVGLEGAPPPLPMRAGGDWSFAR